MADGPGWRAQARESSRDMCSVATMQRRLPCSKWVPAYRLHMLLPDLIAGITVGLTAIPQGIAYAIVAGLTPQYGLYSNLMGGVLYAFFGSCHNVIVGPTAIMAVMVSKYVVGYSADFAILATFLTGCFITLVAIFRLGFLLDFISSPVVSGFTTAAALQIAVTQLKALFGATGSGGSTFIEGIINFIRDIEDVKLWESVLGLSSILMLILLKMLSKYSKKSWTEGFPTWKNILWSVNWFICTGKNAVVVFIGIIIAYSLYATTGEEPLMVTGTIQKGLPAFSVPPFSTVVGNETYGFTDMMRVYGPESVVLPLIAILDIIAIARAFAKGKMVDSSQEMLALGLCNMIGAFGLSIPLTGSFTRTALNDASGVQTPVGGIFKAVTVVLALTLLTDVFYYIPRATIAGVIINAMFSMIDYYIFKLLWRNRKAELAVLVVTIGTCLVLGLEYGIIAGILLDTIILMFKTSRPNIRVTRIKVGSRECTVLEPLSDALSYCAADTFSLLVQREGNAGDATGTIIVDGRNVRDMDTSVARNLSSVIMDLERCGHRTLLWNFSNKVQQMCEEVSKNCRGKFVKADSLEGCFIDDPDQPTAVRTS